MIFLIIVVYMLPSIIAALRGANLTGSVFVLNVFLGWTFIGWVVCLAMAAGQCKSKKREEFY